MEFILKNKKLFAWLFWLWVILILYFTITPRSPQMKIEIHEQDFRLDYLLHFLVYFGLSILYFLWKADRFFKLKLNYLIYFLVTALFISGISEYIQTYIPGRSFNLIDYYSNSMGIIFGILAPRIIIKSKKESE